MPPDWKVSIRNRTAAPVRSRVPVSEGDRIHLTGLRPFEAVFIGGVEMSACDRGALEFIPNDHDDFRCHVGLLEVVAEDGSSFEFDIAPGKMSRAQYDLLKAELQAMWAGIILDPTATTSSTGMANPADLLWDHRTRSALDSLVARPPVQLRPVSTMIPLDRARHVSAPDASFVRALKSGLPTRSFAPAPVECELELGFVRDSLERLRALALRQRNLAPSGSATCGRLDSTIVAVGRYLEHPTLRVPRFDGRPTHLLRSDRRLRRFVELRAALTNCDAPVVEGPGELRLGIRGLDRLYELWVFLATLKEAIKHYGQPQRGLESLAHRLGSDRLRLHIVDGTEVLFPGNVRVAFNPAVSTNRLRSWAGLELSTAPNATDPPQLATPDVVVLGPRNDALVIDAKYRARYRVDEAAIEIHTKYSRFRRSGEGIVAAVVAAHPHQGFVMRYAGYSMLPFVPGEPLPELPWPASELPASVMAVTAPDEQAMESRSDPVVIEPPTITQTRAEIRSPAPPPPPAPPEPISTPAQRIVNGPNDRIDQPDLVIVDQGWVRQTIGSRRLNFRDFAVFAGVGPKSPGYFVGYTGPGVEALMAAARASGWHTKSAIDTSSLLETVDELVHTQGAKRVVVVSDRTELIGLLRSLCDEVEVVNDLTDLMST